MSTAQPKPAISSSTRTSTPNSTTTSNVNRSPSRMAKATTATNKPSTMSASSDLNRARSVRTPATPISARAAAAVRKPAESDTAVEDLRAEMQAKLDDLQTQLQESQTACVESQKHATLLQVKLDDAFKDQGLLEENVHEQNERVEELENARKEIERSKRELEQIYEIERAASMKEREESQAKQSEMEATVHRLKESMAQRDVRLSLAPDDRPSPLRAASFRSNSSTELDGPGHFAPPSSVQRSDSRSSSKLVMQKDKIIEGLRMELAEAQIRIVELENMGGGQLQEVQRQLYEVKIQNARLMEENESFQLLLSEKTLNGDFAHSDLLNPPSIADSRPPSRQPSQLGTSLADELASSENREELDGTRKHQSEINSLRDQNKALSLYINNIIFRLLQTDQFEQILDKTPELMSGPPQAMRPQVELEKDHPPAPPPKDVEPAGFLQRAKSVMGAAAKPIRPLSLAQAPFRNEPRLTENPDTAPSIPLGRSSSVRMGSNAHRRTNSDWNTASVTNNIFRGPSPGTQGPISPGLASPTTRTLFLSQIRPTPGQRVPSNVSSSAVSETEPGKENMQQQRDSKLSSRSSMISHRTSMTSTAGFTTFDALDSNESGPSERSNPSSPPRSIASSNEKDGRTGGGAVMMGSKMRPLRLVQEASKEDDLARKQANRGSWFGWMNTPKPGTVIGNTGSETSGV